MKTKWECIKNASNRINTQGIIAVIIIVVVMLIAKS